MNLAQGHSVSGPYQAPPPNLDVKSNMQKKKAARRRGFSTIKMMRKQNTCSYQYLIAIKYPVHLLPSAHMLTQLRHRMKRHTSALQDTSVVVATKYVQKVCPITKREPWRPVVSCTERSEENRQREPAQELNTYAYTYIHTFCGIIGMSM